MIRQNEAERNKTARWPRPLTDVQWLAVIGNDAACDGQFFYAVKTTGIFCRPSCKSRLPKRENIGCFPTAEQALNTGYRPCKRCKPTGQRLPDEEWITLVADYVAAHYQEALSLNTLANISHGSPYHLHRTFRKVTGYTPVQYIQAVRIKHAKSLLCDTDRTVADIGGAVGLPNTGYFITWFKKVTGHTPGSYRRAIRQQPDKLLEHDSPATKGDRCP